MDNTEEELLTVNLNIKGDYSSPLSAINCISNSLVDNDYTQSQSTPAHMITRARMDNSGNFFKYWTAYASIEYRLR